MQAPGSPQGHKAGPLRADGGRTGLTVPRAGFPPQLGGSQGSTEGSWPWGPVGVRPGRRPLLPVAASGPRGLPQAQQSSPFGLGPGDTPSPRGPRGLAQGQCRAVPVAVPGGLATEGPQASRARRGCLGLPGNGASLVPKRPAQAPLGQGVSPPGSGGGLASRCRAPPAASKRARGGARGRPGFLGTEPAGLGPCPSVQGQEGLSGPGQTGTARGRGFRAACGLRHVGRSARGLAPSSPRAVGPFRGVVSLGERPRGLAALPGVLMSSESGSVGGSGVPHFCVRCGGCWPT